MVKLSPLTSSSISSRLCCGRISQTSSPSPSPGCGFYSSPFSPCPDGLPLHVHCDGSERTATTHHGALWRQARQLTESNKTNTEFVNQFFTRSETYGYYCCCCQWHSSCWVGERASLRPSSSFEHPEGQLPRTCTACCYHTCTHRESKITQAR